MYYNTNTKSPMTEAMLKLQGLPIDDAILQRAGIYPLEYNRPEHDPLVDRIVPQTEPVQQGDRFVQGFDIIPLDDETLMQTLQTIAQEKTREVQALATEVLAPLTENFSYPETMTFNLQAQEVAAYAADPNAPTPTLDGLAQGRGISREEQIAKATVKAQAFSSVGFPLIGRQQGYEDQIKAIAANAEKPLRDRILELKALSFDLSLPETV